MNNFMKYSREPIVGNPELGVFFFGIFYLIYRGLWFHVFMMGILLIPTLGLIWIWYIFNSRRYLTQKLYLQGYFDKNILILG